MVQFQKPPFLRENIMVLQILTFKTKSYNEVMLIFNKELSVSPITTHIPINKVTKKIKKKL